MCTLGLIILQDQKIKSNNYHFVCVGRLITILVLFLLQHLNWIERYSTMKIGRFFCLSIFNNEPLRVCEFRKCFSNFMIYKLFNLVLIA